MYVLYYFLAGSVSLLLPKTYCLFLLDFPQTKVSSTGNSKAGSGRFRDHHSQDFQVQAVLVRSFFWSVTVTYTPKNHRPDFTNQELNLSSFFGADGTFRCFPIFFDIETRKETIQSNRCGVHVSSTHLSRHQHWQAAICDQKARSDARNFQECRIRMQNERRLSKLCAD